MIGHGNIDRISLVKNVDKIHMCTNSQLVPSMISGKLSFKPEKQPAILSIDDPRSQGQDPIETFMEGIDQYYDSDLEGEVLDEIFETMTLNYEDALEYPYGKRELTFEEACEGLPGHLASIYTKSSPGFPLIQFTSKQGKKEYVRFDENGELVYDDGFKTLVEQHYNEMEEGTKYVEHKWIGYMKDELVRSN